MATTATIVTAVAAVAGAGAETYQATKPGQTFKARPPAPPSMPDSKSLFQDQQEEQAKTAGGTILAKNNGGQVSDNANGVRKTLLGQ